MTQGSTPTEDWPKAYLLEVYSKAVQHGFIELKPISSANADSFRMRFYRLRRRSDKQNANIILPEYHMVNVGKWHPGPDGRGVLPIIFNKLPSGMDLPEIVPIEGRTEDLQITSIENLVPAEAMFSEADAEPIPAMAPEPPPLELNVDGISDFVRNMMKKAEERQP